MGIQLFDSELAVMDVLWTQGPMTASDLAKVLKDKTGWSRNTSYTVIRKCVDKGAITRTEPRFFCTPAISREQAQSSATDTLIDRMFSGSRTQFLASFLRGEKLSSEELAELRRILEQEQK